MWNIIKKLKLNLSKKILKRTLGLLILLWLGTLVFSVNTDVFAQSSQDTTVSTDNSTDKIIDFNDWATRILQLIYSLLWPVLFIAWIALDNTLVYGSFLHIDASLWSLWNIMKNFANFALWFLVLFAIVRNIFTSPFGKWWSWDKRWPVSIIKKTLIAWVLIQMSWFLMAAVIDVSTILTYSIGGLPMTVLQNNESYKDMPVMGVNAKLEKKTNDNGELWIKYYNTYAGKKISLCDVREVNWLTGSYIVWKEEVFVDSDEYFEEWFCSLSAWPYRFEELSNIDPSPLTWYNDNQEYQEVVDNYFSKISSWDAQTLVSQCYILSLDKSKIPETCIDNNFGIISKDHDFFKNAPSDWKVTIDSLLEKSKWFVWPFITIYSSLLDYTSIADGPWQDVDVTSAFFMLLIKVLFAAALFFPLLALAVVLLVRIWVLWLAIASMPIIILFEVFKWAFGKSSKISDIFPYFEISHLIKLIFAPVFVVFAISMSLIFLTALWWPKDFKDTWLSQDEAILSEFGMEKVETNTYSIFGLMEFELDQNMVDDWLDTFAWFITKLFAVWIIWFFLFAAVKATVKGTKLWDTIWDFQKGIQSVMSTLPVIPFPWGGIWVGAAKAWLEDFWKGVWTKALEAQKQQIKDQFPWLYPESETTKSDKTFDGLAEWTISNITGQFAKWTAATEIWNNLNSSDKKALEERWITDAWWLSAAYNTYVTNNIDKFTDINQVLSGSNIEWETVSTYDAENLTTWAVENLANSGWKWEERAKWVLGGNVKTAWWTKVMVNSWTHSNPQFKLVDQNIYSRDYLWIPEWEELNEQKMEENLIKKLKEDYQLNDKNLSKEELEEQKKLYEEHLKEYKEHIGSWEKEINSKASESSSNSKKETSENVSSNTQSASNPNSDQATSSDDLDNTSDWSDTDSWDDNNSTN